ncbi:MAG: hypothetical protein QXR14_07000 [Sulfolobales archaeon]
MNLIESDVDAVEFSKETLAVLAKKSSYFNGIRADIAGTSDSGFYVDRMLRIRIASIKKLVSMNIPQEMFQHIYRGGVTHEALHIILLPFMKQSKYVLAIAADYLRSRGYKLDWDKLNHVDNAVSDAINEIIATVNNLPNSDDLKPLNIYYVLNNNPEDIAKLASEKDLLTSFFITAKYAIAMKPQTLTEQRDSDESKKLSQGLVRLVAKISRSLDIYDYILELNSTAFISRTLPSLLVDDVLYKSLDVVVDATKKYVSGDIDASNAKKVFISALSSCPIENKLIWTYYHYLVPLYIVGKREVLNIGCACDQIRLSPDELDDIMNELRNKAKDAGRGVDKDRDSDREIYLDLLSSKEIKRVSSRLLMEALRVAGSRILAENYIYRSSDPIDRKPYGIPDPRTLMYDDPSKIHMISFEQGVRWKRGDANYDLPSHITVIIDESGSTIENTDILSPIAGRVTKVYDVERTIAMALLYNVIRLGGSSVKTALYRFSNNVDIMKSTARDVYEWLATIVERRQELMMGDTNIEKAVADALENHIDSPKNYFVLITDMLININQAVEIRRMMTSKLRRSPILIISINNPAPMVIEELDRDKLIAVASVLNLRDLEKVERAIAKLAKNLNHL